MSSGNLGTVWIYLTGPLAGGLLAVAMAWAPGLSSQKQ